MPEENTIPSTEKREYHKVTKKTMLVTAAVCVFVAPIVFWLYYSIALNRPSQGGKEATFTIDRGEGAFSIASRLYAGGLINSKALFNLYVVTHNLQSNLQAGVYKIPAGYSTKQLVDLFQNGRNDVTITFLEGWRLEEIAREASTKLEKVGYEQFITYAKPHEGTLFPDTYEFSADASEIDVVTQMTKNFATRTKKLLTPEALGKVGLSHQEVLVLASIVEREVSTAEDRKVVAAILTKRYKNSELVGADATTQYAVALYRICVPDGPITCFYPEGVVNCDLAMEEGNAIDNCIQSNAGYIETLKKSADWWPASLTREDLVFPSQFNTRVMVGLPPAPISNPGISALEAVLVQTATDYNYYLTDSKGVTHYAKTLDLHNQNVANYLAN